MVKQPWESDIERDEADPYIESLRGWVHLFLIALFAIICAGIVYELAQPWVADVISNWDEVSR